MLIALAVIGILSIAALFAGWQWWQAEKQRNLAEAQKLAAQADLVFAESDSYLERSALLAIESMTRLPLFENDSALRQALSLLPRPIARLRHEDWVWAVAFSPDGRYLATGSLDKTARVFEAATGKELARLPHEGEVRAVAFSPDGRYLNTVSGSSGSKDLSLRRYLFRPKDLIAEACSRLTRNLTQKEWKQYLGDIPYRKTCPKIP